MRIAALITVIIVGTRPIRLAGAVEAVVSAYDRFTDAFAKEGKAPQRVEEGSEEAYLMACFHKARARGKLNSVESLRAALEGYKWLVAYFEQNDVDGMKDEAQICREMAELLPRRIEMVAAKKGAAS